MKVYKSPAQTVFGLASASRRIWIAAIMYRKEEILAVQTLRNYIMATSVLASTSVAIIFGLAAFISNLAKASEPAPGSIFAFTTNNIFGVKILLFMMSHIVSFFFLSQSLRFYNHVCISVNVNVTEDELAKLEDEAVVAYEHLDANSVGKEKAPKISVFQKLIGNQRGSSESTRPAPSSPATARTVVKPRGLQFHKREPQPKGNMDNNQMSHIISVQGL
ncbi:hypothetical protein BDEG_27898 [Batrachochytrium dendrobatidis JEL423]|uniref:Uncharacterized protein n=1 Tax=Batrachochytrium dendrobatidis (strain JEL423) TaxID=403673 RepID=A0A177WXT7_BATDL|nr:hypothetical protein BDEG_27898 [Batrachochytrium dendrobatidis JEL423]